MRTLAFSTQLKMAFLQPTGAWFWKKKIWLGEGWCFEFKKNVCGLNFEIYIFPVRTFSPTQKILSSVWGVCELVRVDVGRSKNCHFFKCNIHFPRENFGFYVIESIGMKKNLITLPVIFSRSDQFAVQLQYELDLAHRNWIFRKIISQPVNFQRAINANRHCS